MSGVRSEELPKGSGERASGPTGVADHVTSTFVRA